jgi:2-polyprenyl-3-methyl-5-hydroxy-6-metoxy-1,4-benzoquinol methylase
MNEDYRNIFYKNYFSEKSNKSMNVIYKPRLQNWITATMTRIDRWLPESKDLKILDLGCGFGSLLMGFKLKGYRNLTGIDISNEQILMAKNLNPEITFNRIDIISFLRNNNEKFDLITAFDVLEHLRKQEALEVLELIHNALNENGQLIIQTPNAESPWFGNVAFGDFTHEWFYTIGSLEDVLLKIGFKNYCAIGSKPGFVNLNSSIRRVIWELINLFLVIWNLSETGSKGSGIYTRVFLARVIKNHF